MPLSETSGRVNAPVLSVCIPTYNFGAFIGDAIESVLRGPSGQVELVILDGGSTDDTANVVARYQTRHPQIRYVRLPARGGIDADLARTIALATGEYCWLLSADDVLMDGAIARILEEIRLGCDIYLCNRLYCDLNLRPLREEFWLDCHETDLTVDFGNDRGLEQFFLKAGSIGALFSFMSSIVIKRSKWNETSDSSLATGTNYAHVYRLFSMRSRGCRMKYLRTPLVFARGDNDSFMSAGLLRRTMIDVTGYGVLAEQLFGSNQRLRSAFLGVLHRSQPYAMVVARSLCANAAEWRSLESDFHRAGYPRWISFMLRSRAAIWPSRVILRLYREKNVVSRRIAVWRASYFCR